MQLCSNKIIKSIENQNPKLRLLVAVIEIMAWLKVIESKYYEIQDGSCGFRNGQKLF